MWKTAEAATQAHYTQGAQFAALADQMAPYETQNIILQTQKIINKLFNITNN